VASAESGWRDHYWSERSLRSSLWRHFFSWKLEGNGSLFILRNPNPNFPDGIF